MALVSSAATAAETNLALGRFEPSAAGEPFFGTDSALIEGDLLPSARLTLDWAHNPLVLNDKQSGDTIAAVVRNQAFLNFGASLAISHRLALAIDLPVALYQDGPKQPAGTTTLPTPRGAHLGDIRLGARLQFYRATSGLFTLGAAAFVAAPLGSSSSSSGAFASDGQFRGRVELLASGMADRFLWTLALGPDLRRTQRFLGVEQGTMVRVGGGAGVLLLADRSLQVGPELAAAFTPNDISRYNTNLELLLGARLQVLGFEGGLGVGPGLSSGIGTPDYRVVATLGYAPRAEPTPPTAMDTDADGILDPDDACPTARGSTDPDPAKHGCPKPVDQDGDGIADTVDACPQVPGEASAEPAKHGCPKPSDKDKDSVTDDVDACVDIPGVASSDPKQHGCPAPSDQDSDGIVDEQDACPQVAGAPNADAKKHGCPAAQVVGKQIVILDQVRFETNSDRIKVESETTLQAILGAVQGLPTAAHLRVEGHTDNQGSAKHNRNLSERRAKSVVAWLVAHGVDASRLNARGFGPDRPLASNKTPAGRQVNRRVEIHIVE